MTGELFDELAALTSLPGPSGDEGAVAEHVVRELRELGLSPRVDALGNVVVQDGSGRPACLVTAHMDQVGFMVSRVGDSHASCLRVGQASFEGRVPARVLAGDGSALAGTLERDPDREGLLRLTTAGLEHVRPGDRVLYDAPLEQRGDAVRGCALDDRVGCWLLLKAAADLAGDMAGIAFAWTVSEELGFAGVLGATRALDPERVVAVDITYAGSNEASGESDVLVGAGPAITLLDGGMVAHRPLLDAFTAAGEATGVAWQREVVRHGVSEAGKVQHTLGVPSLALVVPVASPHSPAEEASVRDIGEARRLLVAGLRGVLEK